MVSDRLSSRMIPAICLLLFIVLCTTGAYFTQDDAFISFRYARNAAEGHGLKFNISSAQPVEGFTNMLWTLILIPVFLLKFDPVWAAKILGVLSGILTLLYIYWFTGSFHQHRRGQWVALTAATVNAPMVMWAVSGLETMLFTLSVTGVMTHTIFLVSKNTKSDALNIHLSILIIWSIIAVLTRPEGVLFVLVTVVLLTINAIRKSDLKHTLFVYTGFMCLAGAIFAGCKYAYFGSIIPNTFYAKTSLDFISQFTSGCRYVSGWLLSGMWGAVLLMVFRIRKIIKQSPCLYLLIYILPFIAYVICIGGDFMVLFRFLVPIIPGFIILAVMSLDPHYLAAVFLAFVIYSVPQVQVHSQNIRNFSLSDPFQENSRSDTLFAQYLSDTYPDTTTIAVYNTGRIPYYTGFETIDTLGLNDDVIAQFVRHHDFCQLSRELLNRQPDIIIPHTRQVESHEKPGLKSLFRYKLKGSRPIIDIGRILFFQKADLESNCPEVRAIFEKRYQSKKNKKGIRYFYRNMRNPHKLSHR